MSAYNANSVSPIDKLYANVKEISLTDDMQKSDILDLKGQLAYMTAKCESKDRQLLQATVRTQATYEWNLKYSKMGQDMMEEYKDENRKLRAQICGLTDENKKLKVRIWRMQFAAVVHFAVWGCITIYNTVYNMIVM
jgi:hypothetical protein